MTALVVQAIKNIFQKKKINGPISVPELHDAEKRLIKMSQEEMDVTGKRMQSIIPFVDKDGIWKAKGRLENARQLPQALRDPIILLNSHPLVKLLLRRQHQKLAHCGYKRLMVEIRQWYWVIGLRDVARNHVKACIPCKLMRRRACEQYMGQLPVYRTDINHPAFANTVLDLFGPFEIKLGRKTIKEAWCRIFTCMTSRAILLELLYGQIYRYVLDGIQKLVWSDRGTNFVGSQKYLLEMVESWDIPKIKSSVSEFGTSFEWCWNVPKDSHMNGVVESLIKSVRRALESSCKMIAYTEEQWRTYLAEATFLVNSRPLYPASGNNWEEPPINPNDLIIGPKFWCSTARSKKKSKSTRGSKSDQ